MGARPVKVRNSPQTPSVLSRADRKNQSTPEASLSSSTAPSSNTVRGPGMSPRLERLDVHVEPREAGDRDALVAAAGEGVGPQAADQHVAAGAVGVRDDFRRVLRRFGGGWLRRGHKASGENGRGENGRGENGR